ncbi:hypothetical protein [Paenibacillus sp. J5C2022]|uniref:hypothetical protein n=1 Tax=Paenibacillus sp. J5C2022 TaxID=2977129 RepID=UPI0021CF4C3E|nr:hypothetical protein [Paenibacillus sp. J5C2022]
MPNKAASLTDLSAAITACSGWPVIYNESSADTFAGSSGAAVDDRSRDAEGLAQVQLPIGSLLKIQQELPDVVIEVELNGSSYQLVISALDLPGGQPSLV